MPKRKISKAAIRNWMLLQMPTTDGSGHTFSKKNVANIVKEAEELVRTLLLLVDSPDTSTITPVVVLNTVRINEIASKSA
jgi:phosphotransferase system IIA component